MSDVVRDPLGHNKRAKPIFGRGLIVVIQGEPTRKLWVWESKYDASYKTAPTERERDKSMSYLLKDGPGEKAKDVCWASEVDLIDWTPEEEEPLIDLS